MIVTRLTTVTLFVLALVAAWNGLIHINEDLYAYAGWLTASVFLLLYADEHNSKYYEIAGLFLLFTQTMRFIAVMVISSIDEQQKETCLRVTGYSLETLSKIWG